jgi:hypothetical protein
LKAARSYAWPAAAPFAQLRRALDLVADLSLEVGMLRTTFSTSNGRP